MLQTTASALRGPRHYGSVRTEDGLFVSWMSILPIVGFLVWVLSTLD